MSEHHSAEERPFYRSPIGLALVGFMAVGAFLLIFEHRAHIFAGNWFLWLLPLGCVAMHFFHGGHGHHRGHGGDPKDRDQGGLEPKDRRGDLE